MDVDGDGDLDFVLSGDPDRGSHVQWVENKGGDAFEARVLDDSVEGLPDASKRGRRAATLAADFNNDGRVDIYMSACINFLGEAHPTNCSYGIFYENLGAGRYRAVQDHGLDPPLMEFAAAAGDVNGDGLLDLFVSEGLPFGNNIELVGVYKSKLYINKGDFKFEDSGLNVDNPSTCISTFVDYDNDGDLDIVTGSCFLLNLTLSSAGPPAVQNIPGPVKLLKNMHKEFEAMFGAPRLQFEDVTDLVFGPLDRGLWFGVSMADLNGDGRVDFYFGNTGDKRLNQAHLLLLSQPGGTYRNETVGSGVGFHEFNWGSDFMDLNNDGNVDLVTVGALSDNPNWLPIRNPGSTFMNMGGGGFEMLGDLGLRDHFCSGLATADYNEDGSQDAMVLCSTATTPISTGVFTGRGRLFLFKGTAAMDRHVGFALSGVASNSQGIGANVRLCAVDAAGGGQAPGRCQLRVVTAGCSYASTHSPVAHFGVPEGASVLQVG
ncbi:unnamed protein product [Ostreobium quekettii]|uniref:ASPIC/UnbV domain-containing protein n=1 Tax=Ostreobium quekettii TaxID=121088 RepID=A0A8S1IV56_9CHLO|nr:unnamed protein product [Ostreobium quekettii]